jgi:hypothetical protein
MGNDRNTSDGSAEFAAAIQHLVQKAAPTMHLLVPQEPNPGASVPTQHLVPAPTPAPTPPPNSK